ncbi:alginate lyase family protein [Brevundimonas staleyi]|uniref:Alginate lyase family protein n=1 Tax=Brevundimonas staleyi TaxID=74326 RepID=A0ABW0FNS5_9CAUL
MRTGLTTLAVALLLATPAPAQDYAIFGPEVGSALASVRATDDGQAVIAAADAALTRTPGPLPVVHTEGTLPGQGIRDESLAARRDLPAMLDFALAWRMTGERKYLEATDRFLKAWAEVYIVSLNPIDETNFDALILAYDLTEADLPTETRAAMDGFLRNLAGGYLDEMDGAPKHFYTNWQSHRIKIAAMASFQLGDPRLIERTFEDYQKHVASNVLAEGTVFDFYERDAIHYVLYNVDPMMMAGLTARAHGLDWFDWKNASGTGVSSVIDWLIPYVEGEKTHQEFVHSRIAFDAQRLAAGQTEYAGPWRPERAVNTLNLASLLDDRYAPPLEALLTTTERRPAMWIRLYRAVRPAPQTRPVATAH